MRGALPMEFTLLRITVVMAVFVTAGCAGQRSGDTTGPVEAAKQARGVPVFEVDPSAMAAPAILVFDPAGNFVRAWSASGSGYEWPEREHGIHIDHKGYVWVGGNQCPERDLPGLKRVWDEQILKFTQDGRFVSQRIRHNAPFARNLALSPDPEQQFLYVAATARGLQKLAFKGMKPVK